MIDLSRRNSRRRGAAITFALVLMVGASASALSATDSASPDLAASNNRTTSLPPTWRVTTLEHVDLWLHGFAMLTSDTGNVPFFARGYKQQIAAAKREQTIVTQLDANRQALSARFATNPALANAQFLAMYFSTFQEIVTATDFFIRSSGNPRAARDPRTAQDIAMLASLFPQPADRTWLRMFVESLQDESTRFFHAYWTKAQTARAPAFAAFNEQWASHYYPKLARFLNNTQQPSGQLVLSLPLGGEGRTVNDSKQSNMIAVEFPATVDAAPEALFAFVHEAVAQMVSVAITDNTTPAEQRSGAANEYAGNGSVRSGAVLLQRVAPELVPSYMRYYLRALGRPEPGGDPTAAFVAAFPIPATILTAVTKQIDVVLGGI